MKKLMLLGTFLLVFLGLNSACSAATLTIQTGNVSGIPAGSTQVVEVNIKINGTLATYGSGGYQSILNAPLRFTFTPGDTIQISARVGRWLVTGIGENVDYLGATETITVSPQANATYNINYPTGGPVSIQ